MAPDRRGPPPRDGKSDFLARLDPDGIPMTGEEDPLAEVDHLTFAPIAAEFVASERRLEGTTTDAATGVLEMDRSPRSPMRATKKIAKWQSGRADRRSRSKTGPTSAK